MSSICSPTLIASVRLKPENYVVTAAVPVFAREEILEQFRNSDNAALIMTSVGAEGIDLQFCSRRVAHTPHYDGVKKGGKEPAVIGIFGQAPIEFKLTDLTKPPVREV